jgi:pyruvate dehydrogenase E2 component (dihydrolipoamide acetyltransferase)
MVQPIVMPKPGQMTETCTVLRWLKQEGEAVKKGDVLFEIETDKAAMEVESFYDGTLLKVVVKEGVTVPVASVCGFIGNPGEAIPAVAPPPAAVPASAPAATAPRPAASASVDAGLATSAPSAPVAATASAAPPVFRISPRAQRLARESLIDATKVRGSGPGGRVVERDVRSYLEAKGHARIRLTPAARELAAKEAIDILGLEATGEEGRVRVEDVERAIAERPKPMSRMRQVIADRLSRSMVTAPHFYVTTSVDMTDLSAWRAELKKAGAPFTVTDFILKAVVQCLVEFPVLNSSTDGRSVRWNSRVNLGLAVSVEAGLVVPVIRNAQDLSIAALHDRAAALAAKARDGKLAPDEMAGSTFTVSNMGMLGVEAFTAIINPPEAAILAVASILPQAVVKDGQVVARQVMKMTLSSDHRLVDGALAARFVNALKARIEDLETWKRTTSW